MNKLLPVISSVILQKATVSLVVPAFLSTLTDALHEDSSAPYAGQGHGPCWTFSVTHCDDLWQHHLPQLINYSASKRNHHDSCESIQDKHPRTFSHTSMHTRTHVY